MSYLSQMQLHLCQVIALPATYAALPKQLAAFEMKRVSSQWVDNTSNWMLPVCRGNLKAGSLCVRVSTRQQNIESFPFCGRKDFFSSQTTMASIMRTRWVFIVLLFGLLVVDQALWLAEASVISRQDHDLLPAKRGRPHSHVLYSVMYPSSSNHLSTVLANDGPHSQELNLKRDDTPTPASNFRAPEKRQVVISNPTGTATVGGSEPPGVNITAGGSDDTSDKGGGLTTDQKIQIGVGIPAAFAGLATIWGVWHAYKVHEEKKNKEKNSNGVAQVQAGGPSGGKPGLEGASQQGGYGAKPELDTRESRPLPAELGGFAR